MSECKACGVELEWVRTVAGKAMPLDVEPTDDGNVVLRAGVAVVLGGPLERQLAVDEGETLRMPHHATCAEWSK